MNTPSAIVEQAMDALFARQDADAVRDLLTEDYIQHNPHVPTGRDAILGLLPALREAGFGYTTHRILEDGPLVLTHTTYHNAAVFGAEEVVAFDLWRVEDGRVAEHWDAIQPLVSESVSGRSQVDGASAVVDLDRTDDNKALVADFVREILVGEAPDRIGEYITNGLYDQHNPMVADGPEALEGIVDVLVMKETRRVVGQGNFVLTQGEGVWEGRRHVFYDLFRVERGQIVEHWDVIQAIPEEMAHGNGML